MPKKFTRIISFEVEGEIYDTSTTPEEIIKSYDFRFKGFHDSHEDKCFLEGSHNDSRGRIIKLTKQSKIQKTQTQTQTQTPDTEYFLV